MNQDVSRASTDLGQASWKIVGSPIDLFLALHTGLLGLAIGLAGLSLGHNEIAIAGLIASVFGLPFAWVWYLVLESYRQLNTAKFKVIHDLEKQLPVTPYIDEAAAGRALPSEEYKPLTKREEWVPKVFAFGYLLVGGFAAALLITKFN